MPHIPTVPEVSLDSLINSVLPIVQPGDLDLVCKTLISNSSIQDSDDILGWNCWPHDPTTQDHAPVVLKLFESIVHSVVDSVSRIFVLDMNFKPAQQDTPVGSRHNSSRPDGFFYVGRPKRGSNKVNWTDIVMPMELKNADNKRSRVDNYDKVIWSMHHVMRNDARRRFVHGLTCEDTKARLWYHDRCDIVASEEFDINREGMEAACYDPDVELLPVHDPESKPKYNITVYNSDTGQATVYRTVEAISLSGANRMSGPGTRVWKVRKVVDGHVVGPEYALKDAWVREDRVAEHVHLKAIREAQPGYAQHLLTPVDYGFGSFSLAACDNTHRTLRRTELVPTRKILLTYPSYVGNESLVVLYALRHGVETRDRSNSSRRNHYFYPSRHPCQHYRIVFEEIGQPVHDLRKFTDIFTAIQGGWEGLYAMHLCGYVHRDVSSGNILLVPASGQLGERGVIMDLEYAKKIDATSAPHDEATGTTPFMATEVQQVQHVRLGKLWADREIAERLARSNPLDWEPRHQEPLPAFRYNALHDMESMWWLCIWMLFYLAPVGRSIREQSYNYGEIFRSHYSKEYFIGSAYEFTKWTTHLSRMPGIAVLVYTWLRRLNNQFYESYSEQDDAIAQSGMIRVDAERVKESYEAGKQALELLKEASESFTDTFVPMSEVTDGSSNISSNTESGRSRETRFTREASQQKNNAEVVKTSRKFEVYVELPVRKKIRAEA
ncbi:unnamed protein product [Rhizoctonia solani]|uniref:Fungal-type protein kinase domain-containing protein n=1 Tax=Rhizoctonia solani TaxID=456999 RepID=A0A8H3HZ37_9AGAM|nr:unnamed protein product [Rhizoctonia solani]